MVKQYDIVVVGGGPAGITLAKVYNYFIGGTGLSFDFALQSGFDVVKGYSRLTTRFPNMPGKKDLRLKLIACKKTLKILGGQVFSGEPVTSVADLISFALQKQATVNNFIVGYRYNLFNRFFLPGIYSWQQQ